MTTAEGEPLEARLRRYPVGRYPVQHATVQFHLGAVQLSMGNLSAAHGALTVARDVFAGAGLLLEQAKAQNMLGVAEREAGRLAEARACFADAVEAFDALGQPLEQAAASYNLGLACSGAGDLEAACAAWTAAHELFLGAGRLVEASACVREQGAALLAADRPEPARPLLEQAAELAERGGDLPGLGASANALGLALLALGDPSAAVDAFRAALGAFPLSLRPAEYAMAKANLALAAAHAERPAAARLAARQAVAVAGAAPPVRAQARRLLAELPAASAGEDLAAVLAEEPPDRWTAVLREEALRLRHAPDAERDEVVGSVLDAVLDRTGTSYALVQSLLHVLLELPPATYDQLVRAVVAGVAGRPDAEDERLRSIVRSALARFPLPQWQRLAASLDSAAEGLGQPGRWR